MDRNYQIGEKLITNDMLVVDSLYVDLAFMKYLQLGTLISHQDIDQCMYTAIRDIVADAKFKCRYTNDVEVIFKDVKNIDRLLDTPNERNQDIIFAISPSFSEGPNFVRRCLEMSNQSKLITKNTRPTVVTIDTHAAGELSNKMFKRIAEEYAETLNVEVRVIRDLKALGKEATEFDVYCIGDLSRFNNLMIKELDEEHFTHKRLFCSKVLPLSKLAHLTPDLIPTTFLNIEFVMVAASQFHFLDPFTCLI